MFEEVGLPTLVLAAAGASWRCPPDVFLVVLFYCPDTFCMTVYRVGTAGCPRRIKTT